MVSLQRNFSETLLVFNNTNLCIVLYCIVLYCIVLYCIVLYIYIYIALLAVRTNQKRFQCERPREKRAVM